MRGTTAAVCSVDESRNTAEVKKVERFSKFHIFSFENDGVRVWRSYGIGVGKLFPYKSLIVKPQGSSSLVIEKPFFPHKPVSSP